MKIDKILKQSTEGISKVKLPGGIVGKACYVLMATCGALAAIAVAIRTEAIGIAAIAVMFLLVIWGLRRIFQFADANPDVALMEGFEIIAYRRMQLAQKGIGTLPDSPAETPEGPESLPSPQDAEVALLPDPEPVETSKPKKNNRREER